MLLIIWHITDSRKSNLPGVFVILNDHTVGADAHIGPRREVLRICKTQCENGSMYCRADVGIGPYN